MVAPLPHFVRNWFYGTMLVAGCQYFGMGNNSTPYILSLNLGVLLCLLIVHFFKPDMMPLAIRDPATVQEPTAKTISNKKSRKTN
ncbi:unnamed protein product [Umbelopsis vinacea]